MKSQTVSFRADDALMAALSSEAQRAGVSVSEIIRQSVQKECVPMPDAPSAIAAAVATWAFFTRDGDKPSLHDQVQAGVAYSPGGIDPMGLIGQAARGDIAAQRQLADMAIYLALKGDGCDPIVTLSEGLMMQRLAAAQGNDDDQMATIVMLSLASVLAQGEMARDFASEALARLEMLANGAGEMAEQAAQLLTAVAPHETAETMEIAKDYRDRLLAKGVEA